MLLSFSVSNFGSFKEKATFSMFPGKISKQHENIKDQLDDIISMEFEKRRYALEKNNNNISCNNDLIKNIQEEKALLEKYKKDLNYYSIDRVDEELSNEINNRNYALLKLNQLK